MGGELLPEGDIMFGVGNIVSGDLAGDDRSVIDSALRSLCFRVQEKCKHMNLPPGQVPFLRPSNFAVFVDKNGIKLVVDETNAGTQPAHYYVDMRDQGQVLTLDQARAITVRDAGFNQNIAFEFPLDILSIEVGEREQLLRLTADKICQHYDMQFAIRNLGLPRGYEHFYHHMTVFVQDHPNFDRNVFLMMRFGRGAQHNDIHRAVRNGMGVYGLNVLRADDRAYADDLWHNICVYMLGCKYGVAIFEDIDTREFNPNIALELGFMMALDKKCLLLKEQTVPKLPADVIGRLYREFDHFNISESIQPCIDAWARDLGLSRK